MSDPRLIPRPLECVFLDAGNTLLAPWPTFEGRLVAVASEHGASFEEAAAQAASTAAAREAVWPTDWTDPATQREFWGGFYRDVLQRLDHRGDRDTLVDALYASFSDPASYRLFEDVLPALESLTARGLKLGVISNFEPWLEEVLRREGILHLFSALAISGVLGVAKPEPGIFQAALGQAQVAASAAIHVGDQPEIDGTAARAVGITPVLIDRFERLPPEAGPRIGSLTELVELVDTEA
ncbi:MAG TPA: HAD-IA family hydrolase [Actinomycetes bacterium]|nr:HAD-IA family hydrolase [Actinomycetes bacterium]